jgi:hypothetical protein
VRGRGRGGADHAAEAAVSRWGLGCVRRSALRRRGECVHACWNGVLAHKLFLMNASSDEPVMAFGTCCNPRLLAGKTLLCTACTSERQQRLQRPNEGRAARRVTAVQRESAATAREVPPGTVPAGMHLLLYR